MLLFIAHQLGMGVGAVAVAPVILENIITFDLFIDQQRDYQLFIDQQKNFDMEF